MKQTWEERIAAARNEKVQTENIETGYVVKSLMVDFFISESVIPARCKIYQEGVLKSFNLVDIKVSDLIVKEIFRIKPDEYVYDPEIKKRLHALWLILEYNNTSQIEIANSIYYHALLGAVASLFTALDDSPKFCHVLNDNYKRIFRNFAYHFKFVFINQNMKTLKTLAMHFYEHCRLELASFQNLSKLSQPLFEEDKYSQDFKNLLIMCLNIHSAFYEYNDRVTKNLIQDKAHFENIISFLKRNPSTFCEGKNARETSSAICGNAIGLFVANLSANTTSLLSKRTYSETPLSKEEKKVISREYGHFVQIGAGFRHNKTLYSSLLKVFGIKTTQKASKNKSESPRKLLTASTPAPVRLPTAQTCKTLSRLNAPKVVMNRYSYLWGVLPDGRAACSLNDIDKLRLIDFSDGKTKQEVSLNPASVVSNYFTHACSTAPIVLLKSNTMIIGAYQYIHIIDLDIDHPEPEKIIVLKNGGAMALLALNNKDFAVGDGSGNVSIYSVDSAQPEQLLKCPGSPHPSTIAVSALVQLPNNRLGVGHNDGTIRIWNLKTKQCETELIINIDMEDINNFLLNRNKRQNPTVQQSGKPCGGIMCLEVDFDGNLIAGCGDNVIYLWDLKTNKIIKSFSGHTDWPISLKLLPDNNLLSVGKDNTMRIWGKDRCHGTVEVSHSGDIVQCTNGKIIIADRKTATTIDLSELSKELEFRL